MHNNGYGPDIVWFKDPGESNSFAIAQNWPVE